jgi:hypothetical protein
MEWGVFWSAVAGTLVGRWLVDLVAWWWVRAGRGGGSWGGPMPPPLDPEVGPKPAMMKVENCAAYTAAGAAAMVGWGTSSSHADELGRFIMLGDRVSVPREDTPLAGSTTLVLGTVIDRVPFRGSKGRAQVVVEIDGGPGVLVLPGRVRVISPPETPTARTIRDDLAGLQAEHARSNHRGADQPGPWMYPLTGGPPSKVTCPPRVSGPGGLQGGGPPAQ